MLFFNNNNYKNEIAVELYFFDISISVDGLRNKINKYIVLNAVEPFETNGVFGI